jgi:heme exporter protein D
MQWHSVAEFLNMGGYARYVWGSFGFTAAVIMAEIWQVRASRRAILQSLRHDIKSTEEDAGGQP